MKLILIPLNGIYLVYVYELRFQCVYMIVKFTLNVTLMMGVKSAVKVITTTGGSRKSPRTVKKTQLLKKPWQIKIV